MRPAVDDSVFPVQAEDKAAPRKQAIFYRCAARTLLPSRGDRARASPDGVEAEAALAAIEPTQRLTGDDIRKMITELGDMARVLDSASREDLAELYRALGLAITYDDAQTRADVSISPRVVKVCVRGGT
ncbi:hypothetical protein [Kribbella lupini]|uniref:Uncharacterized protein n=1 Tax=Kribbella lupini TaxID=291602 RepID=A0ABN2AP90_9ACTN